MLRRTHDTQALEDKGSCALVAIDCIERSLRFLLTSPRGCFLGTAKTRGEPRHTSRQGSRCG